ncbi:unnamed protein product [Adineta steineri]|uniref:LicD/FKTN/FKRP nucleotidyltransferase domain-containing protein n=1 Tax=Adineta steineri TaxID=433720 RepID=A0A819AN36_9BILA|nr:unnamed protein product [Adineta steineri]CAF0767988.1 unnamed protein product [Adineta steineri]CAF1053479.1 unnamed protein product [Adineta steineri]CAF3503479.1 unnamed protein product [Adineta steineri]CAF3784621.1 unnamed protein product [Adineta steineri]
MNDKTRDDLSQLRISSQDVVDLIYDTLECLHKVLTENNIRYTIFGGSALGAERHGGLIPWDDDADTATLAEDEQRLANLTDTFAKQGFVLKKVPLVGYRLYHATLAKPRPVDQHPCPFVDVFVLNDSGLTYEYPNEEARTSWPQSPLPYGCFNRLTDVKFGHLTLRGLSKKDVKQHLDDNYGEEWPNMACRDWDHCCYENLPDIHVPLKEDATKRPALHSKHQRAAKPFKSMLNQNTRLKI